MGVRLKRFPEYGVELHICSGLITGPELIRHFQSLGPADALRWIHCFCANSGVGGVDLASLPELRRVIAAKRTEIFGDDPPASMVVDGAHGDEAFFEFWRRFAEHGEPHPNAPLLFPTLEAACDGLGLPEPARKALAEAVED